MLGSAFDILHRLRGNPIGLDHAEPAPFQSELDYVSLSHVGPSTGTRFAFPYLGDADSSNQESTRLANTRRHIRGSPLGF